jgi:hypothetical protein
MIDLRIIHPVREEVLTVSILILSTPQSKVACAPRTSELPRELAAIATSRGCSLVVAVSESLCFIVRQVALLAAAFSAVVLALFIPGIANLAFSPVVRAPCSCFLDNFSPAFTTQLASRVSHPHAHTHINTHRPKFFCSIASLDRLFLCSTSSIYRCASPCCPRDIL